MNSRRGSRNNCGSGKALLWLFLSMAVARRVCYIVEWSIAECLALSVECFKDGVVVNRVE